MKKKVSPNEQLRNERDRRGWTRDYVADQIGSDYQTVARWERGATSPSPYYRQRLCKLFAMDARELGFIKEDFKDNFDLSSEPAKSQSEATDLEKRPALSPTQKAAPSITGNRSLLKLLVIGGVLVVISVFCTLLFIKFLAYAPALKSAHGQPTSPSTFIHTSNTSFVTHIQPGGLWVNPANGQIVHGIMHFMAQAYPTNASDSAIDHVNFTVGWYGRWQVACIAYPPVTGNMFTCDEKISLLGAPDGQISVSFDVYDIRGNVNFAPNGVHGIMYYSA